MTNELVLAPVPPESRAGEPLALTPAQARLRKMVLDSVASPHSKRNYAKALDDLFAFCASQPLSRALLMEWRAGERGGPPGPRAGTTVRAPAAGTLSDWQSGR